MIELSGDGYLWAKALHIIGVIAWMAGLLYLPRLFVYHCGAAPGSEHSETLKVMERRLLRAIMNPALAASLVFGLLLLANMGAEAWAEGWTWVKAAAVAGLLAMHMACAGWRRAFAEDRNTHGHKFYRAANEVPTLLMIVLVIMVVVKPF